jgi:ketosteroid isomerase-like protein
MSDHQHAQLQRLLDVQAIRDCLNRYARGLDRHDEELLASAFHDDAVDHHGDFVGSSAEFVPWANELHESQWAAHTHFIVNNTVDFDGDVAHSETYVLWVLRRKDGEKVDLGGGRYLDRFERRDGEWRIMQRELVIDWHCQADGTSFGNVAAYPTGTWDRSDPSYRRPFELSGRR